MKIKKLFIIILFAWITLVSLSFYWNYSVAKEEQERISLESARTFYEYIVITRLWNARHAGIYVPITESTQPNPFLDPTLREIEVNDNLTLTRINPAFMTRQLSEIANERDGVQFHMTSLNPINPLNTPTAFEREVLQSFENGLKEKGVFITKGDQEQYFYMAPLITTKACLVCHAQQGYKEGDVRGGISVTFPYVMQLPLVSLILGHILIGLTGLLAIFFATKQLNRAYQTIQKQAVIDELTGIGNRRSFSETIVSEFKRHGRDQQPLSIIMCDIDKFKAYNDNYGHVEGDRCLRQIAMCIQSSLKRQSDFCARYGGEEFVILLPSTDADGAKQFAERLRLNIQDMQIPHHGSLPAKVVTISLGVTTTTEETIHNSYEKFINKADEALYNAKKHGRNQVQVYQEITK